MQLEVQISMLNSPKEIYLSHNISVAFKNEIEVLNDGYLGYGLGLDVRIPQYSQCIIVVIGVSVGVCKDNQHPLLYVQPSNLEYRPAILEVLHKEYLTLLNENTHSSDRFHSRFRRSFKYQELNEITKAIVVNSLLLSSIAKTEDSMFLLQEHWLGYI